jgi:hypothetical protein
MLSDEAVDRAATTAVTTWVREMFDAGFKTVAEVNQRDGGRALERSLTVLLNASSANLYAEQAESLFQAGVRDEDLQDVLAQGLNRINVQILRKLRDLGFHVDGLLDLYESGIVSQMDFSLDNH